MRRYVFNPPSIGKLSHLNIGKGYKRLNMALRYGLNKEGTEKVHIDDYIKKTHGELFSPLGKPLVAKQGEHNQWHYAHKADGDRDEWREIEMTQWHWSYQEIAKPEFIEVRIERDGILHIADVRTPSGKVIEIQHSPMKDAVIKLREDYYGDMMWIFDYRGKKCSILCDSGKLVKMRFVRKNTTKQTYYDFGDAIYEYICDDGDDHDVAWCYKMSHEDFISKFYADITRKPFVKSEYTSKTIQPEDPETDKLSFNVQYSGDFQDEIIIILDEKAPGYYDVYNLFEKVFDRFSFLDDHGVMERMIVQRKQIFDKDYPNQLRMALEGADKSLQQRLETARLNEAKRVERETEEKSANLSKFNKHQADKREYKLNVNFEALNMIDFTFVDREDNKLIDFALTQSPNIYFDDDNIIYEYIGSREDQDSLCLKHDRVKFMDCNQGATILKIAITNHVDPSSMYPLNLRIFNVGGNSHLVVDSWNTYHIRDKLRRHFRWNAEAKRWICLINTIDDKLKRPAFQINLHEVNRVNTLREHEVEKKSITDRFEGLERQRIEAEQRERDRETWPWMIKRKERLERERPEREQREREEIERLERERLERERVDKKKVEKAKMKKERLEGAMFQTVWRERERIERKYRQEMLDATGDEGRLKVLEDQKTLELDQVFEEIRVLIEEEYERETKKRLSPDLARRKCQYLLDRHTRRVRMAKRMI